MHLSEGFAVHRWLCNEDMFADHGDVLFFPNDIFLRADEGSHCFCIVLGTGDEHLVALGNDGVASGDADMSVLKDSAANEVATEELAYLQDGFA